LKIDPAPVLAQLPQTAVPRLEYDGVGRGLNTPFQTPGDVSRVSVLSQLSKPVVLAALTLLVGALVLIFFPAMDSLIVPAASTSDSGSPAATVSPEPVPALEPHDVVPVDATVPKRKTSSADQPAPSVPAAKAAVAPSTAARPAQSASSPVTTLVQGKSTRSGVIVFRTQGPSWVEVTDADGGIQIRRTINVGEVVGVSGPLPLSVVVGRADMTEVEVRGKPFALPAVSRENVARFEVK
jgi:cytoskeleton protein RodZ